MVHTQDNAAVSGMRLQIVQLSAKMDSIATKKIAVGGGLVFDVTHGAAQEI